MIKKIFLFTILLFATIAYISSEDNSEEIESGIHCKINSINVINIFSCKDQEGTKFHIYIDKGDEYSRRKKKEIKSRRDMIDLLNKHKDSVFYIYIDEELADKILADEDREYRFRKYINGEELFLLS